MRKTVLIVRDDFMRGALEAQSSLFRLSGHELQKFSAKSDQMKIDPRHNKKLPKGKR